MSAPQLFLQSLGLSDKEVRVYLTLLRRGPSSVRQLASASGINRGTTYDVLKALQDRRLVSYFHKEKKQSFVAAKPDIVSELLEERAAIIESMRKQLDDVLPQLHSIASDAHKTKPVARYYHGSKGMKTILEELLEEMRASDQSSYRVYSTNSIASHLYTDFPNFTDKRVKEKIHVNVIAFGEGGTNEVEHSERRWLAKDISAPTYKIITDYRVVSVSLDDLGQPQGVILQDMNLADTEKMVFDSLWRQLADPSVNV